MIKLRRFFFVLYAVAAAQLLMAQVVFSMGSDAPAEAGKPAVSPDYKMGKQAIDAKDWKSAISSFEKVVKADAKNADAYNYLGYANRQLGAYEQAFTHYASALAIMPEHKGANEYIGEAYLQTGNLAKAEEHLAKLDDICTFGCAEFTMLKRAVEEYRKKFTN